MGAAWQQGKVAGVPLRRFGKIIGGIGKGQSESLELGAVPYRGDRG